MTITGPVYSRGATTGANTVRAYNRFSYKTLATIVAEGVNKSIREDEGDRFFKNVYASSGTTVLVSGIPNHGIEITNYILVASGGTVVTFLSGSTDIGKFSVAINDSLTSSEALRTTDGEAFSINLTESVVSGHLTYRIV